MEVVVDLDNIIQEEAEEDSKSTQPNDIDLERKFRDMHTNNENDTSVDEQFRIKVLQYNKKGTEKLKLLDMQGSIRDLKNAEQLLVKRLKQPGSQPETLKLLAVTQNNIACYYKRSNKFHTALRYLARVLQIEKHVFNEPVSLAATYQNIGAILSEMKKHFEAQKFLRKANELFQAEKERMVYEDESEGEEKMDEKSLMSFKINFIISYYNIAFQLQQVARRDEALEVVTQGKQFSEMELGPNHQLTFELDRLSEQLMTELSKNKSMKTATNNTLLGAKKNRINEEYKNWMSANQVQGIEYSLDNTGRHFLKFNKFKNEVSIETEPIVAKKRRLISNTTRFRSYNQHDRNKQQNFRLPPLQDRSNSRSNRTRSREQIQDLEVFYKDPKEYRGSDRKTNNSFNASDTESDGYSGMTDAISGMSKKKGDRKKKNQSKGKDEVEERNMKEQLDKISKGSDNIGSSDRNSSPKHNTDSEGGVVYMDDVLDGKKNGNNQGQSSTERGSRQNKISEEIESSSKDSKLLTNPGSPKNNLEMGSKMTNSGNGNKNKYKNMKLDGYDDPMAPIIIDNNSSNMRRNTPKKSPGSKPQSRQSNKMYSNNQQKNKRGEHEIPNHSNAFSAELEGTMENRSYAQSIDRNRASRGPSKNVAISSDKRNSKVSVFKKELNESNDEGSMLTKGYGFDKARKNDGRDISPNKNSRNNLGSKNNSNLRGSGDRVNKTQGSIGRTSVNSSQSREQNIKSQNIERQSSKQLNNDMRNPKRQNSVSRNSNRQTNSNGNANRINSQQSNRSNTFEKQNNESQNLDELKSDITPSSIVKSQQLSNKSNNNMTRSKDKNMSRDESNQFASDNKKDSGIDINQNDINVGQV